MIIVPDSTSIAWALTHSCASLEICKPDARAPFDFPDE
jgi:hypothetical protein